MWEKKYTGGMRSEGFNGDGSENGEILRDFFIRGEPRGEKGKSVEEEKIGIGCT